MDQSGGTLSLFNEKSRLLEGHPDNAHGIFCAKFRHKSKGKDHVFALGGIRTPPSIIFVVRLSMNLED